MTTFRVKYSYWIDRHVGDYIYRYASFEILRCRADDPGRHFRSWEEYDHERDCIRSWQKLCDQAATEKETAR